MFDYDVIVLGGGSAGTSAARAAREAGARVAMINDGELGGLCILRGCMPTKALLASAHVAHQLRDARRLGWRIPGRPQADFQAIVRRKAELVARFKNAKIASIERGGYDVIDARARFVDDATIEANGRRLRAAQYVIATGSVPARLSIPGLDETGALTSDDVMRLEECPDALVVAGAGPIGLELSQFFACLGTRVTLVNRSPLLARFDRECGEELTRALVEEDGIEICAPGRIERVEPAGGRLRVHIVGAGREGVREADHVLVAVGRRPAIAELGLERAGVQVEGGAVVHDEHMRTTNPRVWVAGDATGRFQILHLANQEGRVAGANAAAGEPRERIDYRLAMVVVFTEPTFACIGRPEVAMQASGPPFVTGRAAFPRTGRALTMGVEYGLYKLRADASTGEILGASILGPRADDLIHQVALAMAHRDRLADLEDRPWYHPTLSEVVLDVVRDARAQLVRAAT